MIMIMIMEMALKIMVEIMVVMMVLNKKVDLLLDWIYRLYHRLKIYQRYIQVVDQRDRNQWVLVILWEVLVHQWEELHQLLIQIG
jgi:hypothetical protein